MSSTKQNQVFSSISHTSNYLHFLVGKTKLLALMLSSWADESFNKASQQAQTFLNILNYEGEFMLWKLHWSPAFKTALCHCSSVPIWYLLTECLDSTINNKDSLLASLLLREHLYLSNVLLFKMRQRQEQTWCYNGQALSLFPYMGHRRSTNQLNVLTLTHGNEARKKLWGGMMNICDVSLKSAGTWGRSQLCEWQCSGEFTDLRILPCFVSARNCSTEQTCKNNIVMLYWIPFHFFPLIFSPICVIFLYFLTPLFSYFL